MRLNLNNINEMGRSEMRIQSLSENVLLHVQNKRPSKRVFFVNTPHSEVSKLRVPDDASAVEIQHPGRAERPAIQQGDNAESLSIALSWLKDMPAQALRTQEGLAPERILHLLSWL
jgi:hypothetical protein